MQESVKQLRSQVRELEEELTAARRQATLANTVADACRSASMCDDGIITAVLAKERAEQEARNLKALLLIQHKVQDLILRL